MKTINEAKTLGDAIDPKHEIEVLCSNCGYDVDEAELTADTCSDCGEALNLRQNTTNLRDERTCCFWQYTSISTGETKWLLI
jgi:predicted amidophosphoribosyltransferase